MPLGKPFFDSIRQTVTGGQLTGEQVEGLNKIMGEWEKRKLSDLRWLANILAQSFWESDRRWQPILEKGGQTYLKAKKYWPYIGAGLIQVTWLENYKKFGATKASDLLGWDIALKALFDGMINGIFTGKKLFDYFNNQVNDPINARRIVNGTDHASDIAAIHYNILAALQKPGAIIEPVKPPIVLPPILPIPPVIVPSPSAKPSIKELLLRITIAIEQIQKDIKTLAESKKITINLGKVENKE